MGETRGQQAWANCPSSPPVTWKKNFFVFFFFSARFLRLFARFGGVFWCFFFVLCFSCHWSPYAYTNRGQQGQKGDTGALANIKLKL